MRSIYAGVVRRGEESGLVVVKSVFEGNSGVRSVAPTELCSLGRRCVLVICHSAGAVCSGEGKSRSWIKFVDAMWRSDGTQCSSENKIRC